MTASAEQNSEDANYHERRRRIWRKLIEEGVLQDKPPHELTEADLDAISARLLLEDHAAAEGVTIEQMFDEWQDDMKYVHGPFTAEEMIAYMHRFVAEADEDDTDAPQFGKPD